MLGPAVQALRLRCNCSRPAIFVAFFLQVGKHTQYPMAVTEKMASTTYVLLIRHGENEYVTTHKLAGRTPGVRLNERGCHQAEALVTFLKDQPVDVVYSSPLERCVETAEPFAAARGLPVTIAPGVIEVDYGDWQGADLRELSKLPEWGQVQHYPSVFRFPGGETLREVQARAVGAIEQLRAAHPDQIVAVFSHGDIIRTVLAHYFGVPLDLFQRIAIATASVSVLGFFDGRPMVLGMNYVAEPLKIEIKKPENAAPAEQGQEAAQEPASGLAMGLPGSPQASV
jgi:probable phosphoglycerate mutase